MAVTIKNLIPLKAAEATQTTQYTSTNARTVIDKFTATNVSSSPVTITVNIVPLAGTVGLSNRSVEAKTIAAKETYTVPELVGHTLEAGSFISTIASAANSLNIMCSGREIT